MDVYDGQFELRARVSGPQPESLGCRTRCTEDARVRGANRLPEAAADQATEAESLGSFPTCSYRLSSWVWAQSFENLSAFE